MDKIMFVRYNVIGPNGRGMEKTCLLKTFRGGSHAIVAAQYLINNIEHVHGNKAELIDVLDTNNLCYDENGKQWHVSLMPHDTDTFDVDKWLDDGSDDEASEPDDGIDRTPVFTIDPAAGPLPPGLYSGVLRASESDDDGIPKFIFTNIISKHE